MTCDKCSQPGVLNSALGKDFYYCRSCKTEILDAPEISPPLTTKASAIDILGYNHCSTHLIDPNWTLEENLVMASTNPYTTLMVISYRNYFDLISSLGIRAQLCYVDSRSSAARFAGFLIQSRFGPISVVLDNTLSDAIIVLGG